MESLIALFQEDPDAWGSYSIPFVCLLGADLNGEMTEFHVVNSNAKSIGTGLAMDLLRRRAEASGVVRDQLIETGRAWINIASQLTATLKNTELWQGKIQFPGQPKSGTLITNNGMITSLRPLVEQPGYFQSVGDPEQQCRILDAYWKGIKMVLPEAMTDPERFNLQRTLGTTALHGVFVNVLAVMVSHGKSVLSPEAYEGIMREPLSELGETNGEGARYERGSILVTTNLPFDEWAEVFGSERLTGALLDRLTHHVHILEMNGGSYRIRHSRQSAAHQVSDEPEDS